MTRRRRGIPGLSFSWRRATGISAAKAKLSRALGVPLTRSGRERKAGRAIGCAVVVALIAAGAASAAALVRLVP